MQVSEGQIWSDGTDEYVIHYMYKSISCISVDERMNVKSTYGPTIVVVSGDWDEYGPMPASSYPMEVRSLVEDYEFTGKMAEWVK